MSTLIPSPPKPRQPPCQEESPNTQERRLSGEEDYHLSLDHGLRSDDVAVGKCGGGEVAGGTAAAVSQLNYKLQMQKSHGEKKVSQLKVRIHELEAEVRAYVSTLDDRNKQVRHLQSISEAKQLSLNIYEGRNTLVTRLLQEIDPDLVTTVDRLMEYHKQLADNPALVAKLPTSRDLAIEYKKKRLENMQRRNSLVDRSGGIVVQQQLPSASKKMARKPSTARVGSPTEAVTMLMYNHSKRSSSTLGVRGTSPGGDHGGAEEGENDTFTSPLSSTTGSPTRKSGGTNADSRPDKLATSILKKKKKTETVRRSPGVNSSTKGVTSFRLSVTAESLEAAGSSGDGDGGVPAGSGIAKGGALQVNPQLSFNSRRSSSVKHMKLDTFIDYTEMKEVERVRSAQKAAAVQFTRDIMQRDGEIAKLESKTVQLSSKLHDIKIRENALRRDFDKLVARTLSVGIRGMSGGAVTGSNSVTDGMVSSSSTCTSHTVQTARLPPSYSVGNGGGGSSSEMPLIPGVSRTVGGTTTLVIAAKQQRYSMTTGTHSDDPPVHHSTTTRLPEISTKVASGAVRGGGGGGGAKKPKPLDFGGAADCQSPEDTTSSMLTPKILPTNMKDINIDSELSDQLNTTFGAQAPNELPSAPWVPTDVDHVDTTKTAPAFRILLSCYVHDLCNLVRVIQPAQDTLFKESRELQDYMLALWNGEKELACPPSNVDLNLLNLQEIVPSFSSNAVVKQLSKMMENRSSGDKWHDEVDLLILSWRSLTASLQQMLSHFQQQIGVWRHTQLTMWTEKRGVPRNISKAQQQVKKKHVGEFELSCNDEDPQVAVAGAASNTNVKKGSYTRGNAKRK